MPQQSRLECPRHTHGQAPGIDVEVGILNRSGTLFFLGQTCRYPRLKV